MVPFGPDDTYKKQGLITGLRLPSGQVLLNFEQSTRYGVIKELAVVLKAEVVTVKGTWTFVPDKEEDDS